MNKRQRNKRTKKELRRLCDLLGVSAPGISSIGVHYGDGAPGDIVLSSDTTLRGEDVSEHLRKGRKITTNGYRLFIDGPWSPPREGA